MSTSWESMWSANGGLQPGQFFDAMKPLPALTSLLQSQQDTPTFLPTTTALESARRPKVLVPGCGRGYAALEFGRYGYSVVGFYNLWFFFISHIFHNSLFTS